MCTAKEILFAQRLADNEKTIRDRTLKKLKKYLSIKSAHSSGITEEEALRLWKGLFYCMYMADKPLIQEALAEDISSLLHSIQRNQSKLSFAKAALLTFAREWNGIDVFRINKFMMFVRRFLRQLFVFLQRCDWNLKIVTSLTSILEETVVRPEDNINMTPLDLKLHVCSIFLEELAKVGGEHVHHRVIMALLQPYFKVLALTNIEVYCNGVKENIIRHLLRQSSVGQEVECSGEDLLAEEEEENATVTENLSHDEEIETQSDQAVEDVLDPRAGLVDVCIPQLKPNFNMIADALESFGRIKHIRKSKKICLNQLASEVRAVARGNYPLAPPIGGIEDDSDDVPEDMVEKALVKLQEFEEKVNEGQMVEDSDNDSGVDLGPAKRKVRELNPKQKRREKQRKLRMKLKRRKRVGRPDKRKIDKKQEMLAIKQVQGVENMLQMVRSVTGIPTTSIVDKELDQKVTTGVSGFKVSPMLKKKVLAKNLYTSAGFSVESLKSGKKRIINESLEIRKQKKRCSFIESTIPISDSKCNVCSDEKTTELKSVTEDSQVVKLSNGKSKGSNIISANKVNSSLEENKEFTDASRHISLSQSKRKETNTLQEYHPCDQKVTHELGEKQSGLQKKYGDVASHTVEKAVTPTSTCRNQSQETNAATTASVIPRVEKLVINFSDTIEQKRFNSLSTSDKEWAKPLKKGEFEIFIKSRKLVAREKKKGSVQSRKKLLKRCGTKVRTININLKHNQTHEFSDYMRTIKASPRIPFSADLKPRAPAIKKKDITKVASSASPLLKVVKRKKQQQVGAK